MPPLRELPPCTNKDNCRHPGGTLPYADHACYDDVLRKDVQLGRGVDVLPILRMSLTQLQELWKNAHKRAFKDVELIEDFPSDLTSEAMVEWMLQLVAELYSCVLRHFQRTQSPSSTPLREGEVYLRAALYTVIIRKFAAEIDGRTSASMRTAEAELVHKAEIRERLGALLERQQAGNKSVQDFIRKHKPVHGAAQKFGESMVVTSKASKVTDQAVTHVDEVGSTGVQSVLATLASHGEQQINQTGNAALSDSDKVFEEQQSHADSQDDCLGTDVLLRSAMMDLQQAREALKDCEDRIALFAEENSAATKTIMKLEFDNAELGCGLAVLRSIKKGDEVGIRTKLVCQEVGKDVVERLLENPKFQTKFMSNRKRKRNVEDTAIKIED